MVDDAKPLEMGLDERRARFALARMPGIGPAQFHALVTRHGGALEALERLPDLVERGRIPGVTVLPVARVLEEMEALERTGAHYCVIGEPAYPQRLAAIAQAPPLLSIAGEAAAIGRPLIGIVGSRNASGAGIKLARGFAADLARAGYGVISGLARGIDRAAHQGALDAEGLTLAAIASGLDIAYPAEHRDLQERIAAEGAVLSERPLGAVPRAQDFPRRNRIISGLSLGVVVVEAALKSGSLITARFAADQGREVLAVPGSPLDARCGGTNRLLKDGAHLVETVEDVLAVIEPLRQRLLDPPRAAFRRARKEPRGPRPAAAPAGPAGSIPLTEGTLETRLLGLLGPVPLSVDELVRQCDATAAQINEAAFELELDGRIEWLPGNRLAIKSG